MKKTLGIVSILFFAIGIKVSAADYIVPAVADAYIFWHNSKTQNYGSEELLKVRFNTAGEYRRDILVKFNIDEYKEKAPFETVKFRMFGSDEGIAARIAVLKITPEINNYDWNEYTVSGASRPGTNYQADIIADYYTEGIGEANWIDWDITEWVNEVCQKGDNIVNLHIRQMAPTGVSSIDEMSFHSRENVDGNGPELILAEEVGSNIILSKEKELYFYVENKVLYNSLIESQKVNIYDLTGNHVACCDISCNEGVDISSLKGTYIIKSPFKNQVIAF